MYMFAQKFCKFQSKKAVTTFRKKLSYLSVYQNAYLHEHKESVPLLSCGIVFL